MAEEVVIEVVVVRVARYLLQVLPKQQATILIKGGQKGIQDVFSLKYHT